MKVSIYTPSGETSPSSYYRIIQYAKKWDFPTTFHHRTPDWLYKKRNMTLHSKSKLLYNSLYHLTGYLRTVFALISDTIRKPDCIIVIREINMRFISPVLFLLEKSLLKKTPKVIWDFDDDIFSNNEITKKESMLLREFSSNIVVTHNRLKMKLPVNAQNKVLLLPTTDGDFVNFEIDKAIAKRISRYDNEIELLWVATHSSLLNLYHILDALEEAAFVLMKQYRKRLLLNVVCNREISKDCKYLQIKNTSWDRNTLSDSMTNGMIGIMPLDNTEFNKGKGGFKIIQYMSVGLPVIASPVGFNNEIVNNNNGILAYDEDEWINAIIALSSDGEKFRTMCICSRTEYDNHYSYNETMQQWISTINH